MHRAAALLGLFLSVCTHASGQQHRQTKGPATLIIDTPLKKDQVHLRLSDVLPVTVEIGLPSGGTVVPPEPLTRSPGWHLWKSTPATIVDAKGEQRWRRQFWLEPLAPGELTLQIETFTIQEKDRSASKEKTIRFDPIKVQVDTIIKDADINKARPVTSIEELPPAPAGFSWWPWLSAGGVLLFLAGLIVGRLLWRRPPPRPQPSPRDWSLAQLDRLLQRRLPERNHIVPFLSLLSLLLRGYLEKTTPIRARRLTTAELLPALPPHLSAGHVQEIRALLERSDLIRFAGLSSTAEECLNLASKVRSFIISFPSAVAMPSPGNAHFSAENNGEAGNPSLQRTSTSQ